MDIALYPAFVPNSRICVWAYCQELGVSQHSKCSPDICASLSSSCPNATLGCQTELSCTFIFHLHISSYLANGFCRESCFCRWAVHVPRAILSNAPREHTCIFVGRAHVWTKTMSCLNLLPQRVGWIADLAVRYETRLFPFPVLRQLQMVGFSLHTVNLNLGRTTPGCGPRQTIKEETVGGGSTRNRPVGCSLTLALAAPVVESWAGRWHGLLGTIDPHCKWHSTRCDRP